MPYFKRVLGGDPTSYLGGEPEAGREGGHFPGGMLRSGGCAS